MSTETTRLIRDGEMGGGGCSGGGGMEMGEEREIIYLSLCCHHQNNSCINMGSDESHFNVSKSHKQDSVHRPQFFEDNGDLEQIGTKVPLLTNLTPYRLAKPAHIIIKHVIFNLLCVWILF